VFVHLVIYCTVEDIFSYVDVDVAVFLPFCSQPSDIAMVKAMKNPPAGVKLVMESVCVMKGIQPEKVNDPAGTGRKVLLGD